MAGVSDERDMHDDGHTVYIDLWPALRAGQLKRDTAFVKELRAMHELTERLEFDKRPPDPGRVVFVNGEAIPEPEFYERYGGPEKR